jgi:predicted HicB family RNase H-like nuclease
MSQGLHYTYRVEWSPDDGEYVGLVAEFPSLSHLDPDAVEAIRGIRELVEAVVADMHESGEAPPAPLGERRYSGKVFVRTSPELHRRLTIEAAEQGVSVNQWATQKLAERSGGVQYHAALDAAKWAWAGENLEERLAALIYLAAARGAERHAIDFLNHTGNPVLQWNPGPALSGIWDTYFKHACPDCEAERAARAEKEDAVEGTGQLA